jgi:large subunit ribosomal protein L23
MSVLKRPIITEKSQKNTAKGKFVFEVALDANKIQIAKAVEKM